MLMRSMILSACLAHIPGWEKAGVRAPGTFTAIFLRVPSRIGANPRQRVGYFNSIPYSRSTLLYTIFFTTGSGIDAKFCSITLRESGQVESVWG